MPNVWLGVSVEDQRAADERIPLLLQAPAAVRFLSCEPLLEPIYLKGFLDRHEPFVDWVIVGGESGPGARPCEVAWIRDIVEQCKAASVPVFVKQMGAHVIVSDSGGFPVRVKLRARKGDDRTEWPEDLRVQEFPS